MPVSFGSKLEAAFSSHGHLCVGIDPHPGLLEQWGMPDTADSLLDFGRTIIDECSGSVGIVKPQVAFFERHGSRGFEVLEKLSEYANEAKLLVIMDAKRGDIGSTMDGYFDAWLGKTATFICDALTVSPYLGFDSLMPTLSAAHERGKGVFVLAATSNPEAKELQTSRTESVSVAGSIWIKLAKINKALDGDRMGSFGAVIGATINPQNFGIDFAESKSTPILAPGFGAQGVALSQFERLFGEASNRTIANVSRSISEAGAEMVGELILKAKSELRGHESNNYD